MTGRVEVTGEDLTHARHVLAAAIESADELIHALPEPARWSADQCAIAATANEAARAARWQFMTARADSVYRELDDRETSRLRLADLLSKAEAAFPHLLPTAAQMAQDRCRAQANKEGHEIAHGIFISWCDSEPAHAQPRQGATGRVPRLHGRVRAAAGAANVQHRRDRQSGPIRGCEIRELG